LEDFKTTYEKHLKTIGSDLDELQARLQTQIDVMQALIIQLENENDMQKEIIERLHNRLLNLESMEDHI